MLTIVPFPVGILILKAILKVHKVRAFFLRQSRNHSGYTAVMFLALNRTLTQDEWIFHGKLFCSG